MPKPAILLLLAAAALLAGGGGACYQDDDVLVPLTTKPVAKVLLTDAPFPYDSVASVNIYVVRIEANTRPDTSGGGDWVLITEPKKTFDLLTLQQGATAVVGEGELPAGQYAAIRMTIDTSLSSIVYRSGFHAHVNWQGRGTLYALVEDPLSVPVEGAEIVIDFDVGRSFLFDFFGGREFTLVPQLRAINSAATGVIRGTVTTDYTGSTSPLPDASVSVYTGDPSQPPGTWTLWSTGRSDGAGRYTVAFVRAGTYIVAIERSDQAFLEPVITPNVQVTVGDTTTVSVTLHEAGSGGAYVRVSGPVQVGVGGTITLYAAVGDASGNPVLNPSVTWTSAAPSVATVTGTSDTAFVTGQAPGGVLITATSGGLNDSHWIDVVSSTAPVATVTVVPASANLAVGDSVGFTAELRDSTGILLTGRPVSWFTADSTVIYLYPFGGASTFVEARAAGAATLRATSEGKTGQAAITVH